LPLFLDVAAKNQLSENTGDGHRSIREKEVGRESCNIFHPESDFYLTKGDLISTREGFEN